MYFDKVISWHTAPFFVLLFLLRRLEYLVDLALGLDEGHLNLLTLLQLGLDLPFPGGSLFTNSYAYRIHLLVGLALFMLTLLGPSSGLANVGYLA